MSKLANLFWLSLIFLTVTAFFFWPMFLKGFIPIPGDLLVGNYEPYKSNSYFGWGPGGVPNKAQGPDVIRELYPWKLFAIESLKSGQLPLWNPYNFAGNPQLADFQTAAFYPLNFLFFLFPFNFAWSIFIFIQPLLAGIFTYLLTRELGLKKIAAVFSGLVFSFSSYLTVWMEYGNIGHTILWLPLTLFLTEKLTKNFNRKTALFLVLTLTFTLLAGYIQGAIYLFATVFLYFLYRFFQIEKKSTFHLISFSFLLILPFFFSFFQLLPSIELFQLSARGSYPQEEFFRLLSPLYYTITTFVPDFFGHPATRNYWFWGTYIERVSYIGIIPLLLVFLAFLNRRAKSFRFFAIMAVVSYLLSLDIFPTRLILGWNPPVLSTAVPTRILSLFCFSGAILAGMGLNFWLEKKSRHVKKISLAFVAIYLMVWVFVFLSPKILSSAEWIPHLGIVKRNLLLPTFLVFLGGAVLIAGELRNGLKKFLALLLILLTIGDLFYFFSKITPFAPKEFIYPKTPVMQFLKEKGGINRFWGYGIASVETNFATYEKVYSTDGSDALHLKRYGELLGSSRNGKIPSPVPRRDANIFPGFGTDDLRNNASRQRVMNLLGVKYVLNKNESLKTKWEPDYQTFPQDIYQLVWQEEKWQVYENKEALPRIFLTSNYLVKKSDAEIIKNIFDKNFNLKTLILEEAPQGVVGPQGKGEVALKKYTPNQIDLTVRTDNPQFLFLSDSFYPSWEASIDGKKTKIYRADYSFRAVLVPGGKHEISFLYRKWL